jgi:predicted nucleotidyltransferase
METISLVGFGSLASGFATPGSDMDLAIMPTWKDPLNAQKIEIDRDIPRLLEKAVLECRMGGRLLTRTRVPILKVCQQPSEELYNALYEERKKNKEKHAKHGDPSRKSSFAHLNDISKRGAASGSDSEMTDAGKSKHKLKVRLGGSPSGSPGGSRAGSPAAQVNGSRAGSPAASSAAPARKSSISQSGSSLLLTPPPAKTLPSAAEIYQALPAAGMTIQGLINRFKGRVDKSNTQAFIKLVKAVSSFDKQRSWLIPLPQMPSEEQVNKVIQGQKKPGASPS